MRLYKLLKDLPTVKAGAIFKEKIKIDGTRVLKTCESGRKHSILVREIDNFDEWFEPTDSIHWKPKYDDWYFYISDHGSVCSDVWNDNYTDNKRLAFGFVYRTEEECKAALDRKLAEARLRKTSDFEPIFESEYGGWIVYFGHENRMLDCTKVFSCDRGEPVHYATKEDAERSIKENRADWLAYFGIEEWE